LDFFVPYVDDAEKAEAVWQAVKKFAEDQLNWEVSDERIRKVEYVHEGKEWTAEVGEPHTYGHPPS
jgi:hypothetical protein